MFGSKSFLKTGAMIEGVLIESDYGRHIENAARSYHVRVRVTFDDGTTTEFDSKLHVRESGNRGLGASIAVRYDPADRSKIDVDEAEMRRRQDLTEKQRQDAASAVPAQLPANPADALQFLWEQQRAMDLRGSELRRAGAPRDEVGAWVAEKEALDSRFRALKNAHPQWVPIRSDSDA